MTVWQPHPTQQMEFFISQFLPLDFWCSLYWCMFNAALFFICLFDHLILHLKLYYFFKLRNVGDCLPRWVAQPRPLFEPYAADRDRAIGVCVESVSRFTARPPRPVSCCTILWSFFFSTKIMPIKFVNKMLPLNFSAVAALFRLKTDLLKFPPLFQLHYFHYILPSIGWPLLIFSNTGL